MKKAIALLIPVLALAGLPASAGDDAKEQKKKCGAEASVCVREMAHSLKQRGWIGIEWEKTAPRPVISHVVVGSPAEAAGVQVGDAVLAFEGISTAEEDEVVWAAMKRSLLPGKVITLSIVRDGKPLELGVELVAVPDQIIAQWIGVHMLEQHAAPPETEVAQRP